MTRIGVARTIIDFNFLVSDDGLDAKSESFAIDMLSLIRQMFAAYSVHPTYGKLEGGGILLGA